MSIDRLSISDAQITALVAAVWQCLDDMGHGGRGVCGLAHADLRIAYEPFKDPDVDTYDDWLSYSEAKHLREEAA